MQPTPLTLNPGPAHLQTHRTTDRQVAHCTLQMSDFFEMPHTMPCCIATACFEQAHLQTRQAVIIRGLPIAGTLWIFSGLCQRFRRSFFLLALYVGIHVNTYQTSYDMVQMGLHSPVLTRNDPIQAHFRSFHGQYPCNTKRNKVGLPSHPLWANT